MTEENPQAAEVAHLLRRDDSRHPQGVIYHGTDPLSRKGAACLSLVHQPCRQTTQMLELSDRLLF
jgi:hypothetical protein